MRDLSITWHTLTWSCSQMFKTARRNRSTSFAVVICRQLHTYMLCVLPHDLVLTVDMRSGSTTQPTCHLKLPLILGRQQDFFVLLSSIVPAQILFHPPSLYSLKRVTELSKRVQRIANGVSEVTGVCPLKGPACARIIVWVVGLHSVSKTPNLQLAHASVCLSAGT